MAMRFFDVTDVDSDYLRFIFKHYGLDVDKLLYHNEYHSMDDINDMSCGCDGVSVKTIELDKKYLILDDTFTFFDSLYGTFKHFKEVFRDDVKLFPTMLCKFNKHFGDYYTVFDVYSLFSSRYAIFEMINDFKDDVRLHDIVKFNKYDRTFRVYIVLDGDDYHYLMHIDTFPLKIFLL
jgi:hypothetical protein|nr:MAG TPA: hypothetical protein [Bacteriophage sp.]